MPFTQMQNRITALEQRVTLLEEENQLLRFDSSVYKAGDYEKAQRI